MVAVARSPQTVLQFFGNNGLPLVGGTLLTQVGGVNATTYQDAAGLIPLPNPIPLNSRGEVSNASGISCELWLASGSTYTLTLFDANGNQIGVYPTIAGTIDANVAVTLAGDNIFTGNNTFNGSSTFAGNISVIDSNFKILDNVDPSKVIQFEAAALPTSTIAVLNVASAFIVEGTLGAAIASAATVNLDTATGDYDQVTGTVTTTAITLTDGWQRTVVAAAAWPITAGASLIMTGLVASGATYTCNPGDVLTFRGEGAGAVRLVSSQLISLPASVGSSLVLISSATAAISASVDFVSGITSTYDEYEVHINGLQPGTDAQDLWMRISEDAGASFKAGAADYSWNFFRTTDAAANASLGSTGDSKMTLQSALTNTTGRQHIVVRITRPSSAAANKMISWLGGSQGAAGGGITHMGSSYYKADNAAWNGFRFLMSSGTITTGNFLLYGIKKS